MAFGGCGRLFLESTRATGFYVGLGLEVRVVKMIEGEKGDIGSEVHCVGDGACSFCWGKDVNGLWLCIGLCHLQSMAI